MVDTFKYIYKNFFKVFLFALLPALFFGSFVNVFDITNFVANYSQLSLTSLSQTIQLFISTNWTELLLFILSGILIFVFMSAYIGNIETHFRSGKFKKIQFADYLNNNLLVTLAYGFMLAIIMILYKILIGILIFTSHIIFSGIGNIPNTFTIIFVILLVLFSFVLLSVLFNVLLLAMPITISTGYSIRNSFFEANEILVKRHTQTMLSILVVASVVFAFNLLGILFGFSWLSSVLSLFIMFMYYPILSFVTYYDYSDIKRYDNVSKYYLK